MKLSTLIAECQKILAECGDIDVIAESRDGNSHLLHAIRIKVKRTCDINPNRVEVSPPPVSVESRMIKP